MEGVEKIKKQIMDDARKESDKILNEANAQVSGIKKGANSEIALERKKILARGKKDAEMEAQRVLSAANLEAHNLKLKSQDALIQGALSNAEKKLGEIQVRDKGRYENSLRTLIRDSKEEIGESNLVLSFNPRDKELGKKLASEFNAKLGESVDISGGVIVQTADKNLSVDNSFEQRMERGMDSIRSKVSKILFETRVEPKPTLKPKVKPKVKAVKAKKKIKKGGRKK